MVKVSLIYTFLCIRVASSAGALRRPPVRALTEWYTRDPCTRQVSNDNEPVTVRAEDCEGAGSIGGIGGDSANSTDRGGIGGDGGTTGNANTTTTEGDLTCDIVKGGSSNSTAQQVTVEYWYTTENTDNTTNYLPILEEKLFRTSSANMSWCFAGKTSESNHLVTMNTTEVVMAKDMGVLGISSSPVDVQVDLPCPHELVNASNECYVYQGMVTIFVNEGADLNSTIKGVLVAVKESMDTDVLLGDDMPTVVRVTYLQGRPEVADGVGFVALMAISISALALLLLLFWKQGRAVTTAETSRGLTGLGGEEDVGAVAGTGGDPAGSFHHGHYHYTRDGEKYLSTYCSTCLNTAKGLNETGLGLAAIDEEDDEDNIDHDKDLVMASSKDLGRHCSGMHSMPCKSAYCETCKFEFKGVDFVPVFKKGSNRKNDTADAGTATGRSSSFLSI